MIASFPQVALLKIEPLQCGWVLSASGNAMLIFRSGAEAERYARRYADVLSRCGYAPRLTIKDRGGREVRAAL